MSHCKTKTHLLRTNKRGNYTTLRKINKITQDFFD